MLKQLCASDVEHFRAGGLNRHSEFWFKNCQDPAIRAKIKGLEIPLKNEIYQFHVPSEARFPPDERVIVQREIETMIRQGVIEPVNDNPADEYVSRIFTRQKKSGGYRVILNLKRFNDNVEKSHFKMNSLHSAIDLMSKDHYMASVDFKSAYYSVSIKKAHRKYLRFYFEGQKYEFTCLPNGLTTGPHDFTDIVKLFFKILRENGHCNTFYLDDSFLTHKTFNGCLENVMDTIKQSRDAGFTVHPEKSVLVPVQVLSFLGFILNSKDMTVSLGAEKIANIKLKIDSALSKQEISIQEVAELVGKLVATFPAVVFGRLFYRQIDIDKAKALKNARGNFSALMRLSDQAKTDLNWWLENLGSACKIESKNPDFVIKTDASGFGYGGVFDDNEISGFWSPDEQNAHINVKELLAILYSLQALFADRTNCTVKVLTDNSTAVSYVASMGGKMQQCHNVARRIWEWAIERQIWLIASFIPGKFNVEADKLSRLLNETTEWTLDSDLFNDIVHRYPDVTVDLFASHLNHQLSRYVSWLPDPNALHCDAFTLNWSAFVAYAFPPFNLIGRVLKKVELDRCELVIVVPEWSSQYWFSKLLQMLVDEPCYLPRSNRVLTNPINARATRITARLLACRIRGSTENMDEYQGQFVTSS